MIYFLHGTNFTGLVLSFKYVGNYVIDVLIIVYGCLFDVLSVRERSQSMLFVCVCCCFFSGDSNKVGFFKI